MTRWRCVKCGKERNTTNDLPVEMVTVCLQPLCNGRMKAIGCKPTAINGVGRGSIFDLGLSILNDSQHEDNS